MVLGKLFDSTVLTQKCNNPHAVALLSTLTVWGILHDVSCEIRCSGARIKQLN